MKSWDSKQTEDMDYEYMMDPVPEYLIDRARDCGHKLFELKKIGRRDIEARRAHNKENFTFFNAPRSTFILFTLWIR